MKEYSVSLLEKGVKMDFSSLPVAKITHYPLELGSYKPYAQGVLAIGADSIGISLTSFEVEPNQQSKIGGVFYLFREPNIALEVWATPKTAYANIIEADQSYTLDCQFTPKSGEDLQGKYWGGEIFISVAKAEKHGIIKTVKDGAIEGNFFKVLSVGTPHYGAYASAEFSGIPYHKEKMTRFKLVSY